MEDRIVHALETGRLPIGGRLVETQLAAMLGVSRGPVREALQRLEQQGLVYRLPRRGSVAARLAPDELAEVFVLRADLESLAARLAMARGAVRSRDLAPLRRLVDEMAAAVRAKQFERLLDLDMDFHRVLAGRSGNRRLVTMLDGLRRHTRIAIAQANRNARAVRGVIQSHRRVIDALESGSLARVDAESKRHVLETLDYLGLRTATLDADRRAVGETRGRGRQRSARPQPAP